MFQWNKKKKKTQTIIELNTKERRKHFKNQITLKNLSIFINVIIYVLIRLIITREG